MKKGSKLFFIQRLISALLVLITTKLSLEKRYELIKFGSENSYIYNVIIYAIILFTIIRLNHLLFEKLIAKAKNKDN